MNNYDYIIIGAGASGLLLADAMGRDSFFKEKRILLLDKDAKTNNDRTWCYWEQGEGRFDAIVHKQWDYIYFQGREISKRTTIAPYQYKMIRGIDFYNHFLEKIKAYPNISFKQEIVIDLDENDTEVNVKTKNNVYSGQRVFNSLFKYSMATNQKKYPVLQQHFLGWIVKTKKPVFNANEATYMDFSVPQKGNTRFMYVLPFNSTTALIEYTLFSDRLLEPQEYQNQLKKYIVDKFQCDDYEIIETEKGSIPMTCYDFREHHTERVRFIGTAGGWAKPSTGYTFMSTSKKVPLLMEHLKAGKPLKKLNLKTKFWYYDLLFLDVLHAHNGRGHEVFESMFKAVPPQKVFKFLDENTSFAEDFKIINSCPKRPFINALFKRLF